jgi:hypothetical protein
MMEDLGFDFISTGEVLNQRPMSQNRKSLTIVADDSGYEDVIVRPLSAKLLPETRPEREGLLDRSRLLGLSGRSRKPQMALAKQYGITDYPSPAGGCRLTEPNFCRRLEDLKIHEGISGVRSLALLRYGRHFRLSDDIKLIVGRHQQDNLYLEETAECYDLVLNLEDIPGPSALLPISAGEEHILQAAGICARYGDAEPGREATVCVRSSQGLRRIRVKPLPPEKINSFII